ncbi:MAG TPA: Maf family protein [Candidatus Acidoferrales bacterium]|jgi:septum formation protein|nr:Maf family protein [Candidatus Acidoferrales bacterium]
MKLILASASPRRAEILRNAGIPFETQITLLDESILPGELPGDYVRRLASEKARAAAQARSDRNDDLFIGADTTVVMANEILGKPDSDGNARRMLRLLSGSTHEVHTGLAVLSPGDKIERVVEEITRVSFAPISDDEIAAYIATGEPFDKAGGYGIQGVAGRYVTRIEGCYFNVMGLPLARLWSLLREFGWGNSAGA